MFDIGWSELVVIGVVALIAIGPKELPGVLRMAGQWITKSRRMASDFQNQFQEALREAEMEDLKKQVNEIGETARDFTTNFDPLESVRNDIDSSFAATRIDDPMDTTPVDIGHVPPPTAEPAVVHESQTVESQAIGSRAVESHPHAGVPATDATSPSADHAAADVHDVTEKATAGGRPA